MFDSPHDRAFGVEIECGFPGGTDAARRLVDATIGPGARATGGEYGDRWTVGADGTEVEIRTPILQGEEGFDTLKRMMGAIRDAGGYTTGSDGMHVHHDAPDFAANPRLCVPLVESWRRNRESIQSLVAPLRRNSYGACPEWSDQAFAALTNWAEGQTPNLYLGRNDLNLANLGGRRARPSIEIRLHEGTLDGDVAVAWIQFGQKFLNDVVKLNGRRLRKRDTDEALLDRIKLSPEATAILLSKKEHNFATPLSMFQGARRYDDDGPYYDEGDDYCCACCAGECGPDCCGQDY